MFFSTKMANKTSLFEILLCQEFGHTAGACGALSDVPVKPFALHNGQAVQAGTATVSEAGAASQSESVQRMHNNYLPRSKHGPHCRSYYCNCGLS